MHCDPLDPPATHEYKGRTISLELQQGADETWHCSYIFIRFSPTQSVSITKYPYASFMTRRESEAAALQKVQRLIDAL